MDVKKLLGMKIDWQKTSESEYLFWAIVDGEELQLRLNDFPEEPICTLSRSTGKRDLDDLGENWTLPRHRGE